MKKEELIQKLKKDGIKKEILEAMEKVDRKNFILEKYLAEAYEDHPLPINYKQTISQPYTVAIMLQELELKKGDKVLEIGTGSGWNAALLSVLVGEEGKVYTAEIVKDLAINAKEKLKNYKNITVLAMDASHGLLQYAPYDKIILTAAPKEIVKEFKEQLKDGGILLGPVGDYIQKMVKIIRKKDIFIRTEKGNFVFVPLISNLGSPIS